MNITIIGNGNRELAIKKALSPNEVTLLPYTGLDMTVPDSDLVIVAQDNPLVDGLADVLREKGMRVFGPSKKASVIEGSKKFAKDFMAKYEIPTAKQVGLGTVPCVIKADGLALGKGVSVCYTTEEVDAGIENAKKYSKDFIIEECLVGKEVSILAFTDGFTVKPMVSSMDHKRAYDGDKGPNTGGMGAIAPNPYWTAELENEFMKRIAIPTIEGMRQEGRIFKGVIYFGLILTKDGMKVIEYNCRFGDPEAQAVLELLDTPLMEIIEAIEKTALDKIEIRWKNKHAVCLVGASKGYPGDYEKGKEITVGELLSITTLYTGGAVDGKTTGGRVLNVVVTADTLPDARRVAYDEIAKVSFDGMFYRTDIGLA
jgi:phosphoribosylamine--glycine ligase